MNFDTFKLKVAETCESQGITEYELYYESGEGTSVSVFAHEINEFSSAVAGGVCFRCIVNGKMGYASTEELSDSEAVSIVTRAKANAEVLENDDKEFLGEGGKTYEPLNIEAYELPTVEELKETALKGQEAVYAADPAVIDGTESQAASEVSTIAIFNSKGLDLHYENKISIFMTNAVVTDGTEMNNDMGIKSGDFKKLDLDDVAKKAVDSAKSKLGAEAAPTGSYPVVFAPKAMAALLRTYSSVFSSKNAQDGLSKMAGKEGTKVASDIVTLVDDPFYAESMMPMNFDAEGSPTHKKNVIENGKLVTLLYNLKTAAVAGVETTGNASKASYDSNVGISPFTMYVAPGNITEEELLKKAQNGVYIDSLGGLHAGANAVSGDFSLQSSGFMIENGVKTKAVKSFTVAGNFFDLLNQITAISDKIELPGFGGKTAFGSPAVLVEGLTVAGK
jgi:PmbA protein